MIDVFVPCPRCNREVVERYYCGGPSPDEWAVKYGFVENNLFHHDFFFLACDCGFVITSAEDDYPIDRSASQLRYEA